MDKRVIFSYMMGNMTSVETSRLFEELQIEGPSSSNCDRLPELLSERWEKNREEWENALREQETVPAEATILATSLDGVMVPDKDGQTEARITREEAAKNNLSNQCSGPAGYREVGLGTVTMYAAQQEDNKPPFRLETVRYGRSPEYKKQTLTKELDAGVESILAARPDLTLVAIADGAEENWRYFSKKLYDNAVKIVDFGHACEHLREAMVAYKGKRSTAGRAEYEKLKVILRKQKEPNTARAFPVGIELLRESKGADALYRVSKARSAHRQRRNRSNMQNPCDSKNEALRHELEKWETGHPYH